MDIYTVARKGSCGRITVLVSKARSSNHRSKGDQQHQKVDAYRPCMPGPKTAPGTNITTVDPFGGPGTAELGIACTITRSSAFRDVADDNWLMNVSFVPEAS